MSQVLSAADKAGKGLIRLYIAGKGLIIKYQVYNVH